MEKTKDFLKFSTKHEYWLGSPFQLVHLRYIEMGGWKFNALFHPPASHFQLKNKMR